MARVSPPVILSPCTLTKLLHPHIPIPSIYPFEFNLISTKLIFGCSYKNYPISIFISLLVSWDNLQQHKVRNCWVLLSRFLFHLQFYAFHRAASFWITDRQVINIICMLLLLIVLLLLLWLLLYYLTAQIPCSAPKSVVSHESENNLWLLQPRLRMNEVTGAVVCMFVCLCACQHRIYRDLACVRFRRWIYRVPRGHVTNGVPACALNHIRQTFAPESACSFTYPRWLAETLHELGGLCWVTVSSRVMLAQFVKQIADRLHVKMVAVVKRCSVFRWQRADLFIYCMGLRKLLSSKMKMVANVIFYI